MCVPRRTMIIMTTAQPSSAASSPATPSPVNAQQPHDVRRADLPLSCPTPDMALWNSHPRVYLAIEAEGGRAACPYCGAQYVLID